MYFDLTTWLTKVNVFSVLTDFTIKLIKKANKHSLLLNLYDL